MGDHTECFQVDFDPSVVGYEDLLELFWSSHDPTRAAYKTQYASLVLCHDEAQLSLARQSAETHARLIGRRIETRIEPLKRFWLAEDYHQKYYLRNDRTLMRDFRSAYPADHDFIESTAAARVNAYLRGGPCTRLERDLPGLGLSEQAGEHLRSRCRP